MNGRGRLAGVALAALAASGGLVAEDSSPPVMMAPVDVLETVFNLPVNTDFAPSPNGPVLTRMLVGDIKKGSIAEGLGLRKNMAIVAIQGHRVMGMTQAQINQMLVQEGVDSVVVTVRKSWLGTPVDVKLPVGKREQN